MAVGKLYAFWTYSEFPYVCGGVVDLMRADGYVQVPSYGKGNWWKPIKILPEKEGYALHDKLHALKVDFDNAKTSLRSKYDKLLTDLIPEAKK